MLKAVEFYRKNCAIHGGYVYLYSSDLTLREAEGMPGPDTIWIQPPGTPLVGEAFMNVWEVTRDPIASGAALDAARALALTQLESGGWSYSGGFSETDRGKKFYRLSLDGKPVEYRVSDKPAGWDHWRAGDYREENGSQLDDNVMQAALHFLIRVDEAIKGREPMVRDAVRYGLDALMNSQYPNGGWSANFDRFPKTPPSESDYPIVEASFPAEWSRTWDKAFVGCYVTNDELMTRCITTLLRAHAAYGASDLRYLDAAKRAGDFLLLAQMPDPQPAWAQQYDKAMQPVWSRAFEAPAITSRESLHIMRSLIELAMVTGEKRYLDPIPKALAYFRNSLLPDGTLSRYYELETNRPLYFERGSEGKGFVISYDDKKLSSNYGWKVAPQMDELERLYRIALAGQSADTRGNWIEGGEMSLPESKSASEIIAAMDDRGAWTEPGMIRNAEGKKVEPEGGIISSQTFADHIQILNGKR